MPICSDNRLCIFQKCMRMTESVGSMLACPLSSSLSALLISRAMMFRERLLKFEPIHLSRFVVDFRKRHLHYWAPYYDMHPWERNSKRSAYHQKCALPKKRALVTRFPDILPRCFFMILLKDVICSAAFHSQNKDRLFYSFMHFLKMCVSRLGRTYWRRPYYLVNPNYLSLGPSPFAA